MLKPLGIVEIVLSERILGSLLNKLYTLLGARVIQGRDDKTEEGIAVDRAIETTKTTIAPIMAAIIEPFEACMVSARVYYK